MAKSGKRYKEDMIPKVGWLFLLVGLAVLGYAGRKALETLRIQDWVQVPARVSLLELREERDTEPGGFYPSKEPRGPSYRVATMYKYEWEGTTHTGTRFAAQTLGDSSRKYHQSHVSMVRKRVGRDGNSHCFVNPEDPQESVLSREARWASLSKYILFGLVFFSIGQVLTMRDKKNEQSIMPERKARHPGQAWLWRADWAAGNVHNGSEFPIGLARSAVLWLILTLAPLVLSWVHPSQVPESTGFMLYVAPVPAVLIALLAVKFIRMHRRFGVLRLHLDKVPVHPGETLSGHIDVPSSLAAATVIRHTLSCSINEDSPLRQVRPEHSARAWFKQEWQSPPPVTGPDGGCRITIQVLIPDDLPGRDPDGTHDDVQWELLLEADLPGGEFWECYQLPVFNR